MIFYHLEINVEEILIIVYKIDIFFSSHIVNSKENQIKNH